MGVISRDPEVFAGVASFGRRATMLRAAVESLIDQVDRIGVYLNNYDDVPIFLNHPRIEVARSQDHGDLRDNGKFFFLRSSSHRYYAAADDDIEYPDDYVERLKSALAGAGPGAAVGLHGAVYPTRILGWSKPRRLYHYRDPLQHVMPVHLLGTGTVLFEQTTWNLDFDEFGEPGMADVWFALAAKRRSARLFVVNRSKDWLTDIPVVDGQAAEAPGPRLFAEVKTDDSVQVRLLSDAGLSQGGFERLVESLLESDRFSEDLTLSQAVLLDEVRRQLGWLPLDPSRVPFVKSRLSTARARWREDPRCSGIDADAYSATAIGILTGHVEADSLGPTLDALEEFATAAEEDKVRWKALPYALRFDTRDTDRLDRLRHALLERAFSQSSNAPRELWPRVSHSEVIPLDFALEAERTGVDTGFQSQPDLSVAAARNPVSAAIQLKDFFEARQWSVDPDVHSWKRAFGASFATKEVQLLLCLTALRTGNRGMAVRCLEALRHRWPADFDVRMMDAAVSGASADSVRQATLAGLEVLDGVLGHVGLQPYSPLVEHSDRGISHWMDLFAPSPEQIGHRQTEDPPKTTVIMTAFNDVATMGAAMRSVLASRGVPIELIVVDDASTDGTANAIEEARDPRVKVVTNPTNLGPYVSRNRALELATGDFITIADADDWSHPDRIAYQCARLTEEPHLVGCTVAHVRLRPDGQPDLENNLLFMGHGPVSLMFQRAVTQQVGGFDHVRTRGDIEFIRRLRARFGRLAIAAFQVPLILATSNPTSNSRRFSSEALGRYRRAAREWHAENEMSDALYVDIRGERAPFIAPEELVVASIAN